MLKNTGFFASESSASLQDGSGVQNNENMLLIQNCKIS